LTIDRWRPEGAQASRLGAPVGHAGPASADEANSDTCGAMSEGPDGPR